MHLRRGGLDVFYIDESHDRHIYVVTAICVPFLRCVNGQWTFVWNEFLNRAKVWRRGLRATTGVPATKELHGVKLASGRGNFYLGKHNFSKPRARGVYRRAPQTMDFLPPASVMSCCATRGRYLYGNERLEAAMYALFQRMRKKCELNQTNAITFFDQGHPEYRRLYRKAQVYLPTGSRFGAWASGASANLPLDMFTKDANEKDSRHCYFTQAADLVAYSAFLKIKGERRELEPWQALYSWETAYDDAPSAVLNTRASYASPCDAIVRL